MKETKKGHLTEEERDLITIYHAQYKSVRQIAKEIGRDPATVSRELNRKNAVFFCGRYVGSQTHKNVIKQWSLTHNRKKLTNPEVKQYVIEALKYHWSPQIIAGRLKQKFKLSIHHETIYRFIRTDMPELKKYLVRKKFKRRRHTIRANKPLIPNRIDISKRNIEANLRQEFGHFEADTVLSSRQSKHALVVLVDRATRRTHIKRLIHKKALETSHQIISLLRVYPKTQRKTITYDNGTEFCAHELVNKELKTKSYFCDPYSAWQKGTVENMNGIIRRWFPKGTDFDFVSDAELKFVQDWINNRPMKILNFKTPNEAYQDLVGVAIA